MLPKDPQQATDSSRARRRIIRTRPFKHSRGPIPFNVLVDDCISLQNIHNEVYDPLVWIKIFLFLAETVLQAFGLWPRRFQNTWDFRNIDHVDAVTVLRRLQAFSKAGKVVANNPRILGGGLEGICKGLDEIRDNRVRGEKLVYQVGCNKRVSFDERANSLSINAE
jgi:hypothetical protein